MRFQRTSVLAVFDHDALGEQVVADGVGAGEVAGLLGLGALGDEGVDVGVGEGELGDELGGDLVHAALALGPGDGGAGDLGVAVFEHGEDAVEEREDGEDLGDVAGEQRAGVGGGVGAADELEDGGAGLGGVEVVGQRGGEVLAGLGGLGGDLGVEAGGEAALAAGAGGRCAGDRRRWSIRAGRRR